MTVSRTITLYLCRIYWATIGTIFIGLVANALLIDHTGYSIFNQYSPGKCALVDPKNHIYQINVTIDHNNFSQNFRQVGYPNHRTGQVLDCWVVHFVNFYHFYQLVFDQKMISRPITTCIVWVTLYFLLVLTCICCCVGSLIKNQIDDQDDDDIPNYQTFFIDVRTNLKKIRRTRQRSQLHQAEQANSAPPPNSVAVVIPSLDSDSSSSGSESNTCMVCFKHFVPDKKEVVFTECCGNIIHSECLAYVLEKRDGCPFPYCDQTIIS